MKMIPSLGLNGMGQRPVHPWRALRIAAALMAAGLGGARPALAQGDRVPLAWDAPPGCPTAGMVLADVKRSLAESDDGAPPFVAAIRVREAAGGLWQARLRVETRGGRTERQFEAESCEAIASVAALIIALSAESGPTAVPATESRELAALTASPPSDGALIGKRWSLSQLSLMVNPIVDAGTMPESPARGMETAVAQGWTSPGWRLRALVGAGFFPTQRTTGSGADGDIWLVTISGRGCLTVTPTTFEVGLCLGVELAAMHAANAASFAGNALRAFPAVNPTQFWLSPLGSAVVAWSITPRIAVFGRADVVAPSTRRTFNTVATTLERAMFLREVYVVPAVAMRGALGLELRFF